jgi:hypothetical protein
MPTTQTQPSPATQIAPAVNPEAFREIVLREALADAGLTHGAEPAAIVAALRALYERALFQSVNRQSRVQVYLAAEEMADELEAKLAAASVPATSPLACRRCQAEMVVDAEFAGRDEDGFEAFVPMLACERCGHAEVISEAEAAACAALLDLRDEFSAAACVRSGSGGGLAGGASAPSSASQFRAELSEVA